MNDGFEIPIGGDLGPLQEALASIPAAFEAMGAKLTGAFEKSNASVASAIGKLAELHSKSSAVALSQTQISATAGGAAGALSTAAATAGNLGNALSGAAAGARMLNTANRLLTGINLAATLTGWISRAGGIRAAFAKIPAAMSAIASNPALRKIVIGAAAAVVGIVAIRAAWRTAAAGVRGLQSAASATFRGIIAGARHAASAIGGAFSSLKGAAANLMPGIPLAGMVGGLGGLAGSLTLAVKSIGKAAEMETLETAFAPLLGGADAAQARIAELSRFAAATPFELPEIANGSRVLETLTKGALSTGEGLRMVGDVAAATQQPFAEIAMQVGRLYDGLQSDRPVGEAMMRLQELGIVSGEVRARIEALQKSGAAGPEIWNTAAGALNRFGGSMERQSVTWSGKMSTLRDEVGMLLAAFGKPLIDGLKPYLDLVISKVDSLKVKAAEMGAKIKEFMNAGLAAFQTGKLGEFISISLESAVINGINKFAAGIHSSVTYLSAALGDIMAAFGKGFKQSGIEDVLTSIFEGIGNLLSSKLRDAAADFAEAIGRKKMADDLRGSSKADAVRSGNYFTLAKAQMGNLDLSGGLAAMVGDFKNANAKGKAAYESALTSPLINTDELDKRKNSFWDALKIQINKNQDESNALKKAMDDKLQNQSASGTTPADTLTTALKRDVTSLARVGGGGSATSLSPFISEQKRTNGLLARIEQKLAPTSRIPVIA